MPYGQTDYSQLNRIDQATSDFTDNQIKLGSQAFALLRQKADQQNAMETLRWVADQNFAKQTPKDALETVTKATTMLSKTGGPYSQQAAQQLHGLVTAKMGLDKPDTNLTEGDLAFKAAGGDTTAGKALELMRKEKKPESSFLRTEKTVVNGVTKLADIYGYKNPQGTEVITERKYQDFTPSASSENASKKNSISEQPIQLEIPYQVADAKGNVTISTKNFQGKLGEASRSLQTEKHRIENWFKKYTAGGGSMPKTWYGTGGGGRVGFNLDATLAGQDEKNDKFYEQNPDIAETVRAQAAAYKRIHDLEAEVNRQGAGVGNFKEPTSTSGPAKPSMLTKDQFIQEFQRDYSRQPTDNELAKAKGRYFQ